MRQKLLLLFCFGLFLFVNGIYAQDQLRVNGTVKNESGDPIPSASIKVKGTNRGTLTNSDGEFTITVANNSVLVITSVGYQPLELKAASNLPIVLKADEATNLEEVYVTAANGLKVKKIQQGFSSTVLESKTLTQASPTNVITSLSGKVVGLQINGVSSGINPNYSVVLRGYRSILGNNQALIVLNNVIVPNSILGNLNPDDIEEINVLQGASAAAIYGSAASNGALIVTTKKGAVGKASISVGQTITATDVAYFPKFQKLYGSGSSADLTTYTPYENQQYGPLFDGSMREIGRSLPSGATQSVPYQYANEKTKFWQTGFANQTDFSVSSGSEHGTFFFSGQYLTAEGTIPNDKYNRATFLISGSQKLFDKVTVNYTANYVQNRYDQTTAGSDIYNQILNTPGEIPLTRYQNWETDSFASPDFYYNEYYNNPYFLNDNYRQTVRNDYFLGNIGVTYEPTNWLSFVARGGITTSNQSFKSYVGIYTFSDFVKDRSVGTYKASDITGSVSDGASYSTKIIGDFIATFKKENIKDLSLRLNLAGQIIQNQSNGIGASISGLSLPDLYNLSNNTNPPSASQSSSKDRTVGLYAELYATYKNYLNVHITGRRDQVSVLDPEFNTFYYPAGDVSFVLSRAIPALKESQIINLLKVRAAISNVGEVNIGPYSLQTTYSQGAGYPYNGVSGYTIGGRLVQQGLKPEFTFSREIGFDLDLFKSRISTSFTYYMNNTDNQTLPTTISGASGYTSLLANAGSTSGSGIEASLDLGIIRQEDWTLNFGINYTHVSNKVDKLLIPGLDKFALYTYGDGTGIYAAPGQQFPMLYGYRHKTNDEGKIIVDPVSGYPTRADEITPLGNTQPRDRIGFNLDVAYKNISLKAVAEYRGSYMIYNGGGSTFDFSGASINTVMFNRERFVIPNSVYLDPTTGKYVDNTNITVANGGPDYWTQGAPRTGITENYATSGNFWKLRELSITYEFPQSLLEKTGFIKGASISVVGRNLLIFLPKTNIYTDPEYSAAGNTANYIGINTLDQNPPARFFGGTVKINF